MAEIIATKEGGIIRFDQSDWLSGLVPTHGSSVATNAKGLRGLFIARGIDPFRKPGYLMPGPYGTDVANVASIDAIIKNGVVNGTDVYMTEAATKLQKMSVSGGVYTVANSGAWPHTITVGGSHTGHTTVTGEDVLLTSIGGTKRLLYSWNDNTDGDVGSFDLNATFDDDYMSTVPTSGAVLSKSYPHPMIEGDDGIAYIANGNNVASFNGTIFNPAAINIPADFVVTSFAKTPSYLVMFAYKQAGNAGAGNTPYRTEAKAFFWDYISATYTYAITLPGNYVAGGFIYNENLVGCFVQGRSADLYNTKFSQLLLGNQSGFDSVFSFTDNVPEFGGVCVDNKIIRWNSQGVIYQYGTPHIGYDSIAGKITEVIGGTSNGGLLKNFFSNNLFASAGATTAGGLQLLTTGYYFQSLWSTPIISPPIMDEYRKFRVTAIKVWWGEAASGGQLFTLALHTNRGATSTTIVSNLATIASPSYMTRYELDSSGNPLPVFESISISGQYGSGDSPTAIPPYVETIEIYFEKVALN
jgi:hypothetical protein